MTENEKKEKNESYKLFQERMNLPGCARELTREQIEELKSKGIIEG